MHPIGNASRRDARHCNTSRTAGHAAILLRAIAAAAGLDPTDRQKPILVIEELQSRDWASATFIGFCHDFSLRLDGAPEALAAAFALLTSRLPDWEFRLPGHIVADIAIAPPVQIEVDDANKVAISGPSTVSHPFVVNALIIIG